LDRRWCVSSPVYNNQDGNGMQISAIGSLIARLISSHAFVLVLGSLGPDMVADGRRRMNPSFHLWDCSTELRSARVGMNIRRWLCVKGEKGKEEEAKQGSEEEGISYQVRTCDDMMLDGM
jgi:hypothetical protein